MRTDKAVFLGSTFRDLEHHRRALVDALHDLTWLKVMESRGAAFGRAVENCLRWVRSSDLYIGVYGMCYGSREPETGVSFTELEYDEAMRQEHPCLIYLIDEDRHPIAPSSIDRGQDAEDLLRFKDKVRDANHCGSFRSPEHLQYQVIRDVIGLFDDLGWLTRKEEAPDTGQESHDTGWRIQMCAWGSPRGILDISPSTHASGQDDPDVAASMLVTRFSRGDYSDLDGFVTLRPEIRNALRSFLAVRDIDEEALRNSIISAQDALRIRLLVDVAGLAGARTCMGVICNHVLHNGRHWDGEIRSHGYEMRSFLDVAYEALCRMPRSRSQVIAEYMERARAGKAWHAKKVFEKVLRSMAGCPK